MGWVHNEEENSEEREGEKIQIYIIKRFYVDTQTQQENTMDDARNEWGEWER